MSGARLWLFVQTLALGNERVSEMALLGQIKSAAFPCEEVFPCNTCKSHGFVATVYELKQNRPVEDSIFQPPPRYRTAFLHTEISIPDENIAIGESLGNVNESRGKASRPRTAPPKQAKES